MSEFVKANINKTKYAAHIQWGKESYYTVTNKEQLVCMIPLVYAVHDEEKLIGLKNNQEAVLKYTANEKILASFNLKLIRIIELVTGRLLLFDVKQVNLNQNKFKTIWFQLKTYLKKKLIKREVSFSTERKIMGFYAIPRPVFLCSVTGEGKSHVIFPLDLVIYNNNCKNIVFSIRTSNQAVAKIEATKKATLIFSEANYKNDILALGNPKISNFIKSSDFHLPLYQSNYHNHFVPEGFNSYIEVEILESYSINSQQIFLGRIVYQHKPDENNCLALKHSVFSR